MVKRILIFGIVLFFSCNTKETDIEINCSINESKSLITVTMENKLNKNIFLKRPHIMVQKEDTKEIQLLGLVFNSWWYEKDDDYQIMSPITAEINQIEEDTVYTNKSKNKNIDSYRLLDIKTDKKVLDFKYTVISDSLNFYNNSIYFFKSKEKVTFKYKIKNTIDKGKYKLNYYSNDNRSNEEIVSRQYIDKQYSKIGKIEDYEYYSGDNIYCKPLEFEIK